MARMTFKGTSDYVLKLKKLADKSEETCKKALYVGAGVVADEIRKEIKAIPHIEHRIGTPLDLLEGLTGHQKAGLLDGLGISDMESDNGVIHVKISFDGYNKLKSKAYPNGQPNVLIARAVESGTTFRKKIPFVRTAVDRGKKEANKVMQKVIDEEAQKIMN